MSDWIVCDANDLPDDLDGYAVAKFGARVTPERMTALVLNPLRDES